MSTRPTEIGSKPPARPASATDLIFRRLSLQAPRHYRTLLRAGIWASIIGYALAFASIQFEQGFATEEHPRELYVIAAALLAAFLERSGRLRAGAFVLLTAIWAELHVSLALLGLRAAVGGVFPAVLVGVISIFGVRAGRSVAVSSLLSVPASTLGGGYLGVGPGIAEGDLIYLVALEGSTLGIALLLSLLMNTLDGVLENAEREAQHTASLELQLQRAQKLEALGKLAGGVAHDFNNLLTAIGAYGEVLARHSDPNVRQTAQNLINLKQTAAGLTGHLLDFARKGMTQPRQMDLARAVQEAPPLLGPLMGPKIKLQIHAPEPAFICADPAQIEQVLLNLALNARDAMPDGGTLTIGCRRHPELGRVELNVSDTGHGMDEAIRKQAFEPFFTTKPRSQGTGLGLALVQGILEASGGTVEVQSEPGLGTSFQLRWRSIDHGTRTTCNGSSNGRSHRQ